jgi:carbonic anhydrase
MKIARRELLRMAVAGCACCFAGRIGEVAASEHGGKAAHAAPHWSYEGTTGAEHWGELSPDFRVCQLGLEQTPIDLTAGVKGDPGPIRFDYHSLPLRIVNNGHTVQVNTNSGCSMMIGAARYDLVQFHFHHPSEHLLDGKAYDMEVHFVHKAQNGALAVVGVFFKPGAHNYALEPIFSQMPRSEGAEITASGECDPASLFPVQKSFFRYMGSLTTPPCSEGLTWTIFREPVEASPDQIRSFAALFPNNARPVQRTNRRFIIETGS